MNKKVIEEKAFEDEQLLLDAIHRNHQENYDKLIMENNISKIKKEKKEKTKKRITIVLVCVLTITTLFLATKYDDYSQKQCISNGHSEYFCEKHL